MECGPRHRRAVRGIPAIPHRAATRPLWHLQLCHHKGGYSRNRHVLAPCPPVQRHHRRIGLREPRLYTPCVYPRQKKNTSMGILDPSAGADGASRGARPDVGAGFGSSLRALARCRFPTGSVGCGARRSPGMGSAASVPPVSGAKLRSDANDAGSFRASSMSARIASESTALSAMRPPLAKARAWPRAPPAGGLCPLASASTSASFSAGG
eukprot:2118942-Pleurochrysis_carterae.AAC.2